MKKNSITVAKYIRMVRKTTGCVVLSIALGISISLFANDGVAAKPSLQFDCNRQLVELVEDSHVVQYPSDNGEVCYMLNLNEDTTVDKLLTSFEALQISDEEFGYYEDTFERMLTHISKLPFEKTTADIDKNTRSLELMGVLPSGILMTLSKPYTTLEDNNAILTLVYKREVIMSALVDMNDVASKMMSVESKLG